MSFYSDPSRYLVEDMSSSKDINYNAFIFSAGKQEYFWCPMHH